MEIGQSHTSLREAVEIWSRYLGAKASEVTVAQVIGDDDEKVGLLAGWNGTHIELQEQATDYEVDETALVEQQREFLSNYLHFVSQSGAIYHINCLRRAHWSVELTGSSYTHLIMEGA